MPRAVLAITCSSKVNSVFVNMGSIFYSKENKSENSFTYSFIQLTISALRKSNRKKKERGMEEKYRLSCHWKSENIALHRNLRKNCGGRDINI